MCKQTGQVLVEYLIVLAAMLLLCSNADEVIEMLRVLNAAQSESTRSVR